LLSHKPGDAVALVGRRRLRLPRGVAVAVGAAARRRGCAARGPGFDPVVRLRALVPCPWLVTSYDAEARAYNPDHDVYILAYYQNYHLISRSIASYIIKSRFDDCTLSRMPVSVMVAAMLDVKL
jgi:hypothetical protein